MTRRDISLAVNDHENIALSAGGQLARIYEHKAARIRLGQTKMLIADDEKAFHVGRTPVFVVGADE